MRAGDLRKNKRVLVVDEDRSVHEDLRTCIARAPGLPAAELEAKGASRLDGNASGAFLSGSFEVDSAFTSEEALDYVRQAVEAGRPYALAFVDARVPPAWDGVETIPQLWSVDPELQVVILSAYANMSVGWLLRKLGETDRLLMLRKPFDPGEATLLAIALTEKWNSARCARAELLSLESFVVDAERVVRIFRDSHRELEDAHMAANSRAAELARLLQERTVEALATRDVVVLALAKLAESRDPETGDHLDRMRTYTEILAIWLSQHGPYTDQIDENFLTDLGRSSPLHDIGKVGIPDEILLKPGPLTPEEFEVMKQHAVIGANALVQVARHSDYGSFLGMAAQIARSHHERFQGGGYPDGLCGQEIALPARIVALADVFDALTSVRVYKGAMSPGAARRYIEDQEGRHFDPAVVEAFRACYDQFLEVHSRSHAWILDADAPDEMVLSGHAS